jgi:hypothetical protein
MSDRTLIRILAGLGFMGAVAGAWAYRSHRLKRATRELMKREQDQSSEPVETASEDSFPASDAPAWTGTGV